MRPKHPPRIAVLVDSSSGWGRRIIRGIATFAEKHGPWHLWVEGRGQREQIRLPPGWVGEDEPAPAVVLFMYKGK